MVYVNNYTTVNANIYITQLLLQEIGTQNNIIQKHILQTAVWKIQNNTMLNLILQTAVLLNQSNLMNMIQDITLVNRKGENALFVNITGKRLIIRHYQLNQPLPVKLAFTSYISLYQLNQIIIVYICHGVLYLRWLFYISHFFNIFLNMMMFNIILSCICISPVKLK